MRSGAATLAALALALGASSPARGKAEIDPVAHAVAQKATDYLRGLRSFSVDISIEFNLQMEGRNQQITTAYGLAVERPNKLALVLKRGMMGATVVSDGEKLYTYVLRPERRYTVEEAPESLGELIEDEAGMMVGLGLAPLAIMTADDPHAALMDSLTTLDYVGRETVDGVDCHVLSFTRSGAYLTLWLRADAPPLPVRMTPDLSTMFEAILEQRPSIGRLQMGGLVRFENWFTGTDLPGDRFAWTPPEGAERVDSLLEGLGAEPPSHPLVGHDAPAFELPLLSGGELDLDAHLGEDVVILDFWATWCKPCVRALPELARLAKAYEDRGVVLYAVNQQEEPQRVRGFLEGEELQLRVPLDREGKVGRLYGVDGIPQTVVIGRDGIVHAVHVGYRPGLESTLGKEVEALLAGEDLAGQATAARGRAPRYRAEPVWSVPGRFDAVATDDRGGVVFAATTWGECMVVGRNGDTRRRVALGDELSVLRTGNLTGDAQRELITFSTRGEKVTAHDGGGDVLWSHGGPEVADVGVCDLDGDGLDEVIVGYQGNGGLELLDNDGRRLWERTDVTSLRHVCGGDVDSDSAIEVVTTSAAGQIHLFDAAGRGRRDLEASGKAHVVPAAADGGILVVSDHEKTPVVSLLDADGAQRSSVALPVVGVHVVSAAALRSRPWLAVAVTGGDVHVVDAGEGRILAVIAGLGGEPRVGWLDGQPPLLVVATGAAVQAWRLVGP